MPNFVLNLKHQSFRLFLFNLGFIFPGPDGTVPDSSEAGGSTAMGDPLTFHAVKGENVRLSSGGRVARRVESFCKGLAFSARPIAVAWTTIPGPAKASSFVLRVG